MKSRPHPDPELDRLLSASVDGTLDKTGEETLAARLREEPEARRYYLDYYAVHADLHWQYADAAAEVVPPEEAVVQSRRSRSLLLAPLVGVAALVVMGIFLLPRLLAEPLATVEFADGATLETTREANDLETGDRIEAGTMVVADEGGIARIRYSDGTELTLHGGSRMDLGDPGQGKLIQLHRGKLSASVTPQPAVSPMKVLTETSEIIVRGTIFSVETGNGESHLQVEEGLVDFRRLADASEIEVAGGREVSATLDTSLPLISIPSGEAPLEWELFAERSEGKVTRGDQVTVAGAPCYAAEPYVAGSEADGSKTIRSGISINGRLARLTPSGSLFIRYRSDWGPVILLGTQQPDGRFGGNFEYRLVSEQNPPGDDGWRTATIPLSAFQPVDKLKDRGFRIEETSLSKIIISVHNQNRLQVSAISISPER